MFKKITPSLAVLAILFSLSSANLMAKCNNPNAENSQKVEKSHCQKKCKQEGQCKCQKKCTENCKHKGKCKHQKGNKS